MVINHCACSEREQLLFRITKGSDQWSANHNSSSPGLQYEPYSPVIGGGGNLILTQTKPHKQHQLHFLLKFNKGGFLWNMSEWDILCLSTGGD